MTILMKITSIKKRKNRMYSIWSYPDLVAMLDADTIAKDRKSVV